MRTILVIAGLVLAVPAFSQATAPTMAPSPDAAESAAPRPHRAPGITTDNAVEAAMAANIYCAALPQNFRTTTLVADSAGVPIAVISFDNAAAITQRVAMGKVQLVVKYKMKSRDAMDKAKSDPAFAAELAADPLIRVARAGGIPIMLRDQFVGAIAVSGTTGHDDECAEVGLRKIADRLSLGLAK